LQELWKDPGFNLVYRFNDRGMVLEWEGLQWVRVKGTALSLIQI